LLCLLQAVSTTAESLGWNQVLAQHVAEPKYVPCLQNLDYAMLKGNGKESFARYASLGEGRKSLGEFPKDYGRSSQGSRIEGKPLRDTNGESGFNE
jgi:hypothetical protein